MQYYPAMFGFNTRTVGYKAEEQAAKFLKTRGYIILQTNFTIRGGEVDIVARDGKELVFIEVKMRSNTMYGSALESITPWKVEALKKTALFFIRKTGWDDKPYRFDLVTIEKRNEKFIFELVKNIVEN